MTNRISAAHLEAFVFDLLSRYGVDAEQSASVARIMAWSELVGRGNFGLLRIPVLLKRVIAGVLNGNCQPRLVERGSSLALLEGDNGFGYYVGERGMAAAIGLASRTGAGAVAVRDSNFFGAAAYFVEQAARARMIGLAFSNSFPKVAAFGGYLAALGTNPFAFGAPRRNGETLLVDMATSGLAGSTVRAHLESGFPLPEGLAVDARGEPITDPGKVEDGALLPFGGAKGFALSLMVEVLAGVITGAGITKDVGSMYRDFEQPGRSGHLLLAIDIARLMPLEAYYGRIDSLIAMVKASNPEGDILFPGEMRWRTRDENLRLGVVIPQATQVALQPLCASVGLIPPWQTG